MNILIKSIDLLINLLLLLILISIFVPFSPKMPAPGLDASWAIGLNQAVIQGLAFGRDIIFTLGPYSFIYTKFYHPELDSLMLGGSLYLAISYWLCLILLIKNSRWYLTLFLGFFLFLMLYSRDSLLFSYPLLVGLICFKNRSQKNQVENTSKFFPFWEVLLFTPLGLLPLIKGSLFILCVTNMVLCSLFFIAHNKKTLAIISFITPTISTIIFWLAIGQSLTDLPLYYLNMMPLINGFTEAMSLDGNQIELILYVISGVSLLGIIIWQKKFTGINKTFLWCIFFVFLFMSLKAGFARHYGHALISGTSIMIATILLTFIFNSRLIFILLISSLNAWFYINNHYTKLPLYDNFVSNYSSTWYGFKNRMQSKDSLKQDFALAMVYLNKQVFFPVLEGTTDIYSYHQAYLIASQNHWAPRPIFQSYSVFNAVLAEKNKQHLQKKSRPDNIIFKIEPIDERLPSLEDGSSWPLILTEYKPMNSLNNFLFLQKIKTTTKKTMQKLSGGAYLLGNKVNLPISNSPLFVEINIKPTFLNRLITLFFKPGQLKITLILKDGTEKQYRLVASMAKSGFLISPLIEDTAEMALLYAPKNYLKEKMVRSFVITANNSWQWSNAYTINFKQIMSEV